MAVKNREKTAYRGVYIYINATGEKEFYIRYRSKATGKQEEEPVGGKAHAMTAAKAYQELLKRKAGVELTNKQKRIENKQQSEKWTLKRLFEAYQSTLEPGRARGTDKTSAVSSSKCNTQSLGIGVF